MQLLTVDRKIQRDAVVVRAAGEVDSSNAAQLAEALIAALDDAVGDPSRLVIVDLQALTYFGSAGLDAVLTCHRQAAENGTSVRLAGDHGLVRRIIEVAGLDGILQLYPTVAEALQGCATEPGR